LAVASGVTESDLIARAAAVEADSEHPLAKAIVAEAKRRDLPELSTANFEALPGRGARALVNGSAVEVGGPRLLTEAGISVAPEVEIHEPLGRRRKDSSLCGR
jgi:Cu2+-exporting ATPase